MSLVKIRTLQDEDRDIIFRWISNSSLRQLTGTKDKPNRAGHKVWFEKKIKDTGNITMIIEYDSMPVGLIGTNSIDSDNKNAEVFIYIGDENNRKKGIGKESVELFLEILFKEKNIHKVFCRIFSFNIGSIKLFTSLGFHQEGCLKEQIFLGEENAFCDLLFFGLIKQ